ncbi:phosphonopyruvate decarboxylase [uncultured Eubacterium sp.]|uniref:phosphonopyruvate decarboxylase n=1 Tax=uncultured Eubacterium sp. TaxID=165185 RepID=UPI00259A720B|nr:phosphonopyruvate decarboxylase [uncultured Eubacterium sp.]
MKVEKLVELIGADFYTGVPDSQLKELCNYLYNRYSTNERHHIIAANEGNATAIAAGYHLATGKVPVVYMQNSGEGNIINPVASLLNKKVYGIPAIFIIGWRGEPGVHDEPQHIYQGEVTIKLLDDMGIPSFIIGKDTTEEAIKNVMVSFKEILSKGDSVAFVVRKGALSYDEKVEYSNDCDLIREEIIEHIVKISGEDPIISTTGKASRELFEIREREGLSHKYDFLTVGSMGHTSSIALGVALNKPKQKVWCIDGDGSMLMHMGSLAVVGSYKPSNLVHIIINNSAHETVGGMPTVVGNINVERIATSCGYGYVRSVDDYDRLDEVLKEAKECEELSLIEVKCGIGSRADLGRPTTTAMENKNAFMDYLKEI